MYVRIHKKPVGIPPGSVIVSHGETDMGACQVTVTIHAHDAHDMREAVCSLRLSDAEALDLAKRIELSARYWKQP